MSKSSSLVLEKLTDTLELSSIHGIPNIVRKNDFKVIKIIWFVCFIISTSICGWYVQKSLSEYLNREVVSKTDIVYVDKLTFPIINICNLNLFATKEAKNHVEYLSNLIKNDLDFMNSTNIYGYRIITNNKDQKIKNYTFNRRKFGFNISEIIISCTFNLQNCSLDQDFDYYYDMNYGNCFRFNSGKNMYGENTEFKNVSNNGLLNSLELELFIGKASENDNYLSKDNGFSISINNATLDSISHEGIQISAGFSTRIIVNKYFLTKVPYPYSECTNDLTSEDSYHSDTYKITFKQTKNFRYTDCISVCYQKFLLDNCTCQSSLFNVMYNQTVMPCYEKDPNSFECERTYAKQFYSSKIDYKKLCDCPIECEKSGFTYSTSYAEYPTKYHSDRLKTIGIIKTKFNKSENISYQDLKESLARVIIFYDELKETVITHDIKIKATDLISSIGGLLGLFLGLFNFDEQIL